MGLCACGCGLPALFLRGDPRFASNECKARHARTHAKNESERMERAKAFALGGQETVAPVASAAPQPTEDEMRSIIEEREGTRIRNGKVFHGDLDFWAPNAAALEEKIRDALGVHEPLAERVNLRLHRMAVSR